MSSRTLGTVLLLAFVAAGGGCARYEYDILRPPELARRVGTKQWEVFRVGDLEYRLITSDSRLVALIYNFGERTVKLSGSDSAAIDAQGESHPLQARTIPIGTHVKLILPPPLPQVHSYGPTMGFGVGVVGDAQHYDRPYPYGAGYGATYYDVEPRYYNVYEPADRTYFDWPGETELRLLLAYEPEGGERFRHEFVFRRRRV
jgi:hypothetical protein